jgi:hypothetical protein
MLGKRKQNKGLSASREKKGLYITVKLVLTVINSENSIKI